MLAAVEQVKEAQRVSIPLELDFIRSLQIEDKVSGGLIDFDLWPFQEDLLAVLNNEEFWTFVLKARQLGITWTVEAHLIFLGTFWGNRLFLIYSQSGKDAVDALDRIRIMIQSIPEIWRPKIVKDNLTEIELDNGSRFKAMMATKRAGRGLAPFAVLCDEVGTWQWPEDQMSTIEAGAQRIFVVGTGQGQEGPLPKMWRGSQAGKGRYRSVFYPWHVHPGRDEHWYQINVVESPEPRLASREFAATPEEAFAAPEGIYFQRWSETNKVAMKPQHNWDTWRAVDFGFHWPACLWIQESPSGQSVVVAELAGREAFDWTTEEFADNILAKEATLGLVKPVRATFCDPAGKGVNPQTGESEFAVFAAKGLGPNGETSSVRDGCVRVIDAISDPSLPLLVSDACPWLREALGSVAPDKHKPDIYNDDSVYDHVLDTLRYYFVNRPRTRCVYHPPDYSLNATVTAAW